MHLTPFFRLAAAAALLAGSGGGAAADPHHNHAAANGSAAAPLDIARPATDVPPPLDRRGPAMIRVNLETVEVTGQLADGASYHYWTFNRAVPGPMVRAGVGDTVEVVLHNPADSGEPHSVDFHAATGPGGGGDATFAQPGETKSFTFTALKPGLYVYHCAVHLAAEHIANGMYGMILVEPEEGLPTVDREFYVMQGEIYTEEPYGSTGQLTGSIDKLLGQDAEYFVFNGAANALEDDRALRAEVGETIRIFFGVGGPNEISSFHLIGEIFDTVYDGTLVGEPRRDVSTIMVPPGGASVIDLSLEVPGDYVLVDHALSRAARGLVGKLIVEGDGRPAVEPSAEADPAADHPETAHSH